LKKKSFSGAEIFCKTLIQSGAEEIFGYPGGSIIPLFDTLFRDFIGPNKLKNILVRHEQAAAFAADAFGRVTGKPGICIATSGPGATNLVTGVANAMLDSSPMIAITGQVIAPLLGSDAFQEVDAVGIFMPIVKHSFFVDKAEKIEDAINAAFFLATNKRPGPIHLDITKNAFLEKCEFRGDKKFFLPKFSSQKIASKVDNSWINEFLQILKKSKKPVSILGHGILISKAKTEILEFLENSKIPAVSTLLGLSSIPNDHPNFISMLGMHGSVAANNAVHESDFLISIGCRFDDRIIGDFSNFAPKAKVAHFEIDIAELEKNIHVDLPILGNLKKNLRIINPKIKKLQLNFSNFWEKIKKWKNKFSSEKIISKHQKKSKKKLLAAKVIQILAKETKGKAIVCSDVGQHQMLVAQFFPFKIFNSAIFSGGLGSMGAGLPMAIGAAVASSKKEIWCIAGDGGFQMNSQELITIFVEKLPIKIIILNNSFLGMVRQWQELYCQKNYAATAMISPDFQKLAESANIPSFFANCEKDAVEAIKKSRKINGPVLLEFQIDPEENVWPMVDPGKNLGETRIE